MKMKFESQSDSVGAFPRNAPYPVPHPVGAFPRNAPEEESHPFILRISRKCAHTPHSALQAALFCVLVASFSLPLPAMPTREETARAEPVVKQMLASERAALASGKKTQSEVADAALKLASEADTEAAKLLLMKGAFVLYVKDGKVEKAAQTMNAIEKAIADLPPQSVTNMIDLALLGLAKQDGDRLYQCLEKCNEEVANQNSAAVVSKKTIDGSTWSYTVKNGEATIEAKKDGQFCCAVTPSPKGRFTIPAVIDGAEVRHLGRESFRQSALSDVCIPEGVKTIGHGAFSWSSGLRSVTISSTVTEIGDVPFISSDAMERFSVAQANLHFSSRNGMLCSKDGSTLISGVNGRVTIPDGVATIKNNAFHRCGRLEAVTIPASVTNISSQAFFCTGLRSVTMLGERPNAAQNAFEGCDKLLAIHVPANAKSWAGMTEWLGKKLIFDPKVAINGYTWSYRVKNGEAEIVSETDGRYSCAVLPRPNGEIEIPSMINGLKVASIGRDAFIDCNGMTSIKIPDGVTAIGESAFKGCGQLKFVVIPVGVTNIAFGAFQDCKGLESVEIPFGVKVLRGWTFKHCSNLKSVVIPLSVTHIDSASLEGCGFQTLMIPASVTNLSPGACMGSVALKTVIVDEANPAYKSVNGQVLTKDGKKLVFGTGGDVTIPEGVESIGDAAFLGRGLKSLKIPSGVKHIGGAFAYCFDLKSLTIPASVTKLGGGFGRCWGLTSLTFLGEQPVVPDGLFNDCGSLKEIHVPANAKSWAGMKEWQGRKLVFDAKVDDGATAKNSLIGKDRTTVQSIINGMIKVSGKDFWLSETELTQGQWEAVMGNNPSRHKGATLPVECVSRDDCDVFLAKLNQTKEVQASRFEFYLPTLPEWMYAAQAGGSGTDCWVKRGVVGKVLDIAWVKENSGGETHAVATKTPNAFGFYDMLGNVWEWMYGEDQKIGCRHGFAFDDAAAECSVKEGWHKPRNMRFDHCGLRVAARVRPSGQGETCRDEF